MTPVSVNFPFPVPSLNLGVFMRRSILKFAAVAIAVSSFAFNATAQELQQQTWKVAVPTGERSWFGGLHKWWGSEIEKRSEGKIKIQFFWSDSLVKWGDALPGIQSGVADMAWISSSYHPAQLPNYMALDHMFNYGEDYVAAVKAALDAMDNQPDLKAELAKNDIVPMMSHISGLAPVGTKTPLTNMDVLKGKTLRTYGGARTEFYKGLGWNPVFMVFPDMYPAMDRGTIDAMGELVILLSDVFKLNEVIKNVHMMNPPGIKGNGGVVGSAFFMSGKKFRSLPPATQKMLVDLRNEYGVRYATELMKAEEQIKKKWVDNNKITFAYSTPADEQRIAQAGAAANEVYFKKLEGEGAANVRKVVAYYTDSRKKLEAAAPKK
jgi:TRAP-type C4-dicarboxylate transport system substrate-binding protein